MPPPFRLATNPQMPTNLRRLIAKFLLIAGVSVLSFVADASRIHAGGIFGTLSNFDVFNPTTEPSEGFEIELEDIHSSDLRGTFPSHYNVKTVEDYSEGEVFGVRIKFEDYSFTDRSGEHHSFVNPNPNPQNTNGHFCVNISDCEHFGFSVSAQPSAARYYWLNELPDGQYERISDMPLPVPTPAWSYRPRANGAAIIEGEIELPEPPEANELKPDSIWMKVFKAKIDRQVDLDELMSGPDGIVPQDGVEVETEWELLESGKMKMKKFKAGDEEKAIVWRFEYFEYTGPVDEENEPLSRFELDESLDPVEIGEVGNFISANMVAVNFALIGDATFDHVVDEADFAAMASSFGLENEVAYRDGDFDHDGSVSLTDLFLLQENFGREAGSPEANSAAVPEPSTFLLTAMGLLGLLGYGIKRQRRRTVAV